MPWIAWTPLLRGARNAGRELRQYTVPLCLGVRDPGIAELRSTRVARGVSEPESRLTGHPQPTNYNEKLELATAAL